MSIKFWLNAAQKMNSISSNKDSNDFLKGFDFICTNAKLIDFLKNSNWTSGAGTQSQDTVNYLVGTESLRITENDNTGGDLYSYRASMALNLTTRINGDTSPTSDYIYLVCYISNVFKLTRIRINPETSAGNEYIYTILAANLVNGWNYIAIPKSSFSVSGGVPNWNSITKIYMIWTSTANAQNEYVSFNLLSLLNDVPTL